VLEVIVGDVAGVAAGRGVRDGADLEVIGGPGEPAFLAVEGFPGCHEDEGGGLQVLAVVVGPAHRSWPWS
jgi:hypothetical protein